MSLSCLIGGQFSAVVGVISCVGWGLIVFLDNCGGDRSACIVQFCVTPNFYNSCLISTHFGHLLELCLGEEIDW